MTIAANDPFRVRMGFETFRRARKPRVLDLSSPPPPPAPVITVVNVPDKSASSHAEMQRRMTHGGL